MFCKWMLFCFLIVGAAAQTDKNLQPVQPAPKKTKRISGESKPQPASKAGTSTVSSGQRSGADSELPLAKLGGPSLKAGAKRELYTAPEVLAWMFEAVDKHWLPKSYEARKRLKFRAHLDASLPAGKIDPRLGAAADGQTVDFDLDVEGDAAPNSRYKIKLQGELGELELSKLAGRFILSSPDFRAFSERVGNQREENANLLNWRSYFLRYMGDLRKAVLDEGAYRSRFEGDGVTGNDDVYVVRVYRPSGNLRAEAKAPIKLNKIWTFWKDGAYEIWVHKNSKLPVAIFYTNTDSNIYANMRFDYDNNNLPKRISYNNNTPGAQGSGDLVFTFNKERELDGFSLSYSGTKGLSFRFDATLDFENEAEDLLFRYLPAFGYRKLNHDQLKLMVLTQISGGLLKLRQHGVNLKNFKF